MTADELRAMRFRARLTQAQLAALVFATTRTVQNWEAGKYPIPAHREQLLRAVLKKRARAKGKP